MAINLPRRGSISLRARLAIAAVLWSGVIVSAAAVLITELFREKIEADANTLLRNQVTQLVTLTRVRGGTVDMLGRLSEPRFERPFSGWAWQIRRGPTVVLQSASLGPITPADSPILAAPEGGVAAFPGPFDATLRGLSSRITPPFQDRPLTFAVAMPQAELRRALEAFRTAVLATLGLLAAGQGIFAVLLSWLGLRPLTALRDQVADLRRGQQPALRTWPAELAPVAAELAALGNHVQRLVTRARADAADLAHAIKTPLTVIQQHAEALPPPSDSLMMKQTARIRASLDRHLGRSRAAGVAYGAVSVAKCFAELAEALAPDMAARGLTVDAEIDPNAVFVGDEGDLFEILGNPLDNARKWARSRIKVAGRCDTAEGALIIDIADDGQGIPPDKRDAIFARGRRLDEDAPGSGLGLAIMRDLVALYEGSATLGDSDLGGLSVAIRLPGPDPGQPGPDAVIALAGEDTDR